MSAEMIRNRRHPAFRQALACTLAAYACLLAACAGSDPTTPTPPGGAGSGPPLSRLELFPNRRVAVIGEAITLRVIARDAAGAEVTGVVPQYSTTSAAVVRIDPNGVIQAAGAGTATVRATAGGQSAETVVHVGPATYNLAGLGAPRVLDASYIDLSKIDRISRFRSTIGHSYVDGSGETCRSMKHYYQPRTTVDWTMVDVYAPASGTIWLIATDGAAGFRIMLRPRDLPALEVAIFHVALEPAIVKDVWVEAGSRIGRHASRFTMSDIATGFGGKEQGTLVSYFETMTDAVFAQYQARGVLSREAAIISRAERDLDPVPCVGEQQFTVQGKLPDWLTLN
jgi:hypothetical protein